MPAAGGGADVASRLVFARTPAGEPVAECELAVGEAGLVGDLPAAAAAVVGPVLQATLPSVATAEQVASAITFLLSRDAANINGAILPCDGGWSAI